jgi:hypothetical protein
MPITILDYVKSVAGEKDTYTASDFASLGVSMLGGCDQCSATLGAYNAYPSRSGYWRCADCIGDTGFSTVEEFASTGSLPLKDEYSQNLALHDPDEPWINCPSCGSYDNVREIQDGIFECFECNLEYRL